MRTCRPLAKLGHIRDHRVQQGFAEPVLWHPDILNLAGLLLHPAALLRAPLLPTLALLPALRLR